MLTPEEENKAYMYKEVVEYAKETKAFPRLNAYDIEWLVNKVVELNEEAFGYMRSYQKANEELIAMGEHFERD